MEKPSRKPMRREPWVTTPERGRLGASRGRVSTYIYIYDMSPLRGMRVGIYTGVIAAADDLEVGGDGAEVGVGCAVGEISETEGLANFTRCEELLEL